ncbi:MAG TPA: hypothetical protein DCO72_04150 [Ruminococcus sp.]|nr:hypothetical protein [Ruminococcus sp.]
MVVVALIIAVYRQNTKSVVSLEENESNFTQMAAENEMLENSNTEPLTELEKEEIQAEIIETAPSVIENVVEETQPPETEPATIVASVSQIPQRPDYSGIFRRTQAELSQYIRRFFYSYQDLDCDGIEELIVSYGEMSDTDNNYIYTYQNGSPVYVGEVSAMQGHLCFIPAKHLIIGCDVADGDGVAYRYSIYEMKGTSLEFIESYEYYDGGMDNEPYFRHNGQNADSQEVLDALNDYEVQSIMLEITEYRE